MNIWRMKLRAGSGGEDMWPACEKNRIASFTHPAIYNTDLTNLKKDDVPGAVKGPARSSIWLFAWEIKGGDEIYVGDSKSHEITAKGIVAGKPGKRAYRYNHGNAIAPPNSPTTLWRHEVPVLWQKGFKRFKYKDPAPQHSVYRFKPPSGTEEEIGHRKSPMSYEGGGAESLLSELAYQRETSASKKNIAVLHKCLSNQFRLWLKRRFELKAVAERKRIDLTFGFSAQRHLADLKICYRGDTRHAIREALGQLFEYNHYPSYHEAHFWWIVLDCEPSKTDLDYIVALKERYSLPLTIYFWPSGDDF